MDWKDYLHDTWLFCKENKTLSFSMLVAISVMLFVLLTLQGCSNASPRLVSAGVGFYCEQPAEYRALTSAIINARVEKNTGAKIIIECAE